MNAIYDATHAKNKRMTYNNIKTPFETMLEPCDAYTKRAQIVYY
jgi:hypothetical protein